MTLGRASNRSNRKVDTSTPEFRNWLKGNRISLRKLQRDPQTLDHYYQEWARTLGRPKKPSLFKLPAISLDLDTIANGLRIADKVMKTYKGANDFLNLSKRFGNRLF